VNYPVDSPQQLRVILRAMRKARGLTQEALGERLGVSQKRIARIESAPEVTRFDQISQIVTALGYRLVIEEPAPVAREESPW
jgi:HTH-type transcriptional regulator / antitoxin HipB